MALSADQVTRSTRCPADHVAANWPLIVTALASRGMSDDVALIAAAATVATETGAFQPITEIMAHQDRQPALYASQQRYYPYIGRGFIQITWKDNYERYGKLVGVDLVAFPTEACNPDVAAKVLAAFFEMNHVADFARAEAWRSVRRAVNGGMNGWDTFINHVMRLRTEVANG